MDNFHNISEDTAIYRIFKINNLIDIFKTKKLTLVRPKLWDDPFENFMEPVIIIDAKNNKKVALSDAFNKIFGQCWTLEKENDAMWRIYASNKNGVKVKTTAGKLFDSIYDHSDRFARSSFFIGKVDYKTREQIVAMIEEFAPRLLLKLVHGNHDRIRPEQMLFIKRQEFKHEEEVRILYSAIKAIDKFRDSIEFSIDPCDLFDEIVFDPRIMDESVVNGYIDKFKSFGFTKPIEQSDLYKIPKDIILHAPVTR
ncbi:MAG: DUF2971 domain-containing protein [bacterium]